MSVDSAQAKLHRGLRDLMAIWYETAEAWRDPRAEEFVRVYLQELEKDLRVTLSAMDQLKTVIGQARNDCQ
ncbi:MAG: hypothetical protein HZA50_04110 [Planctomycetes bacterium]|nr:hypothetical protein [Planctomycetota bacterium]